MAEENKEILYTFTT